MNANEKEITGVEDMHGLGSMRDALLKQATALAEMSAREAEREKARTEARTSDDHWRERMEQKTDRLYKVTDSIMAVIAEMPAAIDRQVKQAIADHIAAGDGSRHRAAAWLIVVGILVALAVLATLEFVDRENTAGRISLVLMVVVSLGGWYVSSRRS